MKTKLITYISLTALIISCGTKKDVNDAIFDNYANCTKSGSCEGIKNGNPDENSSDTEIDPPGQSSNVIDEDILANIDDQVDQDPSVNTNDQVDQDPSVNTDDQVDQDPSVNTDDQVDQDPSVNADDQFEYDENTITAINTKEGIITLTDENSNTHSLHIIENISLDNQGSYPVVNSDIIELNSTIGDQLILPQEDSIIENVDCKKKSKSLKGIILVINSSTTVVAISSLKKFIKKNHFKTLNIHISNSKFELINFVKRVNVKEKTIIIGALVDPAYIILSGNSKNKGCKKLDASNLNLQLY